MKTMTFAKYIVEMTENDGVLYRQQYRPIVLNLARKKAKGIYERDKAIKLVGYLTVNAIKKYKHSYEEYEGKKLGNIPASTKKSISIELLSGMLEEIADAEKDIKKKKKV